MAKKKEDFREPELYAVIRRGKQTEIILTWKYYSVVNALQYMGIARYLSYDTAKHIARAKDEEKITIGDVTISIERRLF